MSRVISLKSPARVEFVSCICNILLYLQLSSLNSTHVQSVDMDVVADLRSVLAKHNERISQSEEGLAKINRATTQLAKSSEAGKDLFNTRFTSLQVQK